MGTCPHELCARYLESDPDVSMAPLSEWTQAQEPESVSVADVQLRAKQQSAIPLPPAAAGSTLQTVMLRAQARMQKQVEKGSTKRKAVAALLESPSKKRKSTTVPLADLESPRSKLVQKLAQDLDGPTWGNCFQAILTCRKQSVLPAEAKDNCLDTKLMQLLARDKSLPIKTAAHDLLKFWAASQLVSSISLFHVFN